MAIDNIIELNFSEKLQITINNIKPVILIDLTMALLGVGQQFERFIENETSEKNHISSELFIKEVRSGSIIVELIAQATPIVPLLWKGGSIEEWMNYVKSVMEWLSGKVNQPPKDITKQDLEQWNKILEPVAKDHGSQINFICSNNSGSIVNQVFINSEQANAAQNAISREIKSIKNSSDQIKHKQVMTWYQTKFDEKSKTGNKAIIESISKHPLKVIFADNIVKKALMAGDSRFDKPWNELAYCVDVNVQTIQGIPKAYTVISFYDEDTFDPDE